MSYNDHPEAYLAASPGITIAHPRSFMLYDLEALRQKYDPNHTGSYDPTDQYSWDVDEPFVQTLFDTNGTDTIDATNQTERAIIDLRQGEFSSIGKFVDHPAVDNLAIAFGTVIEDAKGGAGNDVIIGNVENNNLEGGAGDDWLMGDGSVFGEARADTTNALRMHLLA